MTTSDWLKTIVGGVLLGLSISGCGPTDQDQDSSIVTDEIPVFLDYHGIEGTEDIVVNVLAIYENEEMCDFFYDGGPSSFRVETNADKRIHLQFFENGEGEEIGELEAGSYAFVGVALDDVCFKELAGCTAVDLGSDGEIVIRMDEVDIYSPFCGGTGGCSDGYCLGY